MALGKIRNCQRDGVRPASDIRHVINGVQFDSTFLPNDFVITTRVAVVGLESIQETV